MPAPTRPEAPDPSPLTRSEPPAALQAERDHLAASRAQLARMRERTAALDASAGGDRVSREVLQHTLAQRLRQLADDPTVPPFFGRLTYAPTGREDAGEVFHIGRRHVTDEYGDPMVVDWRAPVSRPFYRASRTEPMGVVGRRRFGFAHGLLTGFEDESLEDRTVDVTPSAFLEAEIERPRVGPMRDIVATIQPEQDLLVRADLAQTVCVQGAPGTGKTAVGLHRAAYLLYAHREQLSRQGLLVVGPNASFLRYIRDVLPALGEVEATQTTLPALVGSADPPPEDPVLATLKGDARMAAVLERAVWSHLSWPADATEGLVVPRGARRFRVPAYEIEEVVTGLRARGTRYDAGRRLLAQGLAHRVLLRMEAAGESPDDRVQDAVARSRPVRTLVAGLWPALEPARLLWRLLSEPAFLAASAEGILTEDERVRMLWPRSPRSPRTARWTLADAVLLGEIADRLTRTGSLGHVVVDEAQDLSPMMLRALGRRCSTGSATVLGDLAQATTPWGARSWPEALAHLGKPDAQVEQLTQGFRVPGEVIAYAARLLPHTTAGLEPPTSVRRTPGELHFAPVPSLREEVDRAVAREGSIGLVAPDDLVPVAISALDGLAFALVGSGDPDEVETEFDARLDLVPASLAKGLEYDHVVLLEPAAIVDGEPDRVTGLRRLYVCLTRAVSSLVVVHDRSLPPELDDTLAG